MGNEPINPFEEEIKATEAEANAIGEEVRLLQQETAFDNTRKAMEEANKGWRQMLIDSHKKREAERTKRLRSEQIVGLGKALGDLLGAAFAGAGSVRGNYAAVVPQAQAPKSAERIHQLINEGVVNAKDYDNMLQSLAIQEGRDKIALAKSMDELKLRDQQQAEQRRFAQAQAEQQRDFAKSERIAQQEFQTQRDKTNQLFQASEAAKNRNFQVRLAQMKEQLDKSNSDKNKKKFNDGELSILAAISSTFPETIKEISEVYDPLTDSTKRVEQDKTFVADDKTLATYLLKEKGKMQREGLNPASEDDMRVWSYMVVHSDSIDALVNNGVPKARIIEAIKVGWTIDDIYNHFNR